MRACDSRPFIHLFSPAVTDGPEVDQNRRAHGAYDDVGWFDIAVKNRGRACVQIIEHVEQTERELIELGRR